MTVAATPTGCALSTLVERVRPVTLEVLTAPTDDPVTVRGAVIEDLGDPLPDLPGALLLLVGAAADPELVMTSLRRAAARSFAGVIIKARRRDLTEMLRAAADLSLAVLTINDELSWRELGALLDAALGPFVGTSDTPAAGVGDELFAIADAVAGTIGGSVAIEDLGQHVLAYSSVPGQRIDPLRSQGILDRRVPDLPVNADMYRSVLNAPGIVRFPTEGDELARAAIGIRAGTLPLGTLWVIEGDEGLTAEGDRALAEGAQLAALHMLRARSAGELDQHLRGELLRALLEGAVGSQAAAHRLGLAVGQAQALLALGPSQPFPPTGPPLIPDVAQQVRSQCAALRPDAIVTAVHRAVYVLIAGTRAGDAAARLAASLLGALDRGSTGPLCIGIGVDDTPVPDLAAMRTDADDLLRVLTAAGSPVRIARMHELRSRVLLMHVSDELARHRQLRLAALDELIESDPRRADELVQTLHAWFDAYFDIRRAADRLHIHPNTLRYRLRRLSGAIPIDLKDPDTRLCLWLQLRSDQLVKPDPPPVRD